MKTEPRYRLQVLTLRGVTLTFTVSSYEIVEGGFIKFIDEKTGRELCFHSSRTEIEKVRT